MKLLIVHQAFMSPNEAGGTRHFELGRELVKRGHSVTVVASTVSYLSGEQLRRSPEESFDGVRVLRAFSPGNLHRSFLRRVIAYLIFMLSSVVSALRGGRPDIVMGTSPPIFQAASAWVVATVFRRPFLLEIRDLWPEFAIDMGILRNRVLILLARRFERFLYRVADHVLVNSPGFVPYLESCGVASNRLTVIPNGVDARMFGRTTSRESVRNSWRAGDRFVVVYAGAVGAANNIPTLLDAAALLDPARIQFVIVGDGKERKNAELYARSRGLVHVLFTGPEPKTRMDDILSAADCCIAILMDIPMFRTTYPNKVFDYMAASKPVVLAIDGVIRQVVESANCGIFALPRSAPAIAAAVEQLASDPEAARRKGENGRRFVAENFDRGKQAAEFERLLLSLAGTGQGH